jgi:hypothetical protein
MKRPLIALGLSAALLIAALPAFAHEEHCMEVGGVEQADGQCIQAAAIQITSVYPMEAAHVSNEMAAAIDGYIAESYDSIVALFAQGFVPSVAIPWVMDIQSEVLDGVSTVSAVFTRYTFTGGANGIGEFHTVTGLVVEGNLLALPDIFVEGVDPYTTLQPLVAAILTEQLGDMAAPEMIAAGTAPVPENYQNWALTADSLNIYFDEYQVAPGAAGPQVVAIPLSELTDVLLPQYLPS